MLYVMPAAKNTRWQIVENVVAAIERARAQAPNVVIQKAAVPERSNSDESREVDVLIEVPLGARRIRIGVEVKDEARPLDVTTMEGLSRKKAKLCLDRLCVVSTSGFSEKARREAAEQGLELGTIEEFEKSEWWLAPPIQEVRRNQVELVHVDLQMATVEDRQAWIDAGKVEVDDVELADNLGNSADLKIFLLSQGMLVLRHPEAASLCDQHGYVVHFPMTGSTLVVRERGVRLPCPIWIHATYRLHQQVERVPEWRFRTDDGVEAFTAKIDGVLGQDRQATIVAVPQPDGSKQLVFSLGLAQPRRGERP